MARRGHDLADAALLELLLKGALAPPGDVLSAVVGEDFLGGSIGRDSRAEHLQHQRRRLAGVQAEADEKPAVIIEEGDQVDPPVLPLEHEREQVGLPELVGPGPLEEADLVGMGSRRSFVQLVAGLMEHAGDRWRTGRQRRSAHQHLADPFAPPVGMRLLEQEDGAFGEVGQAASFAGATRLFQQAGRSLLGEPLFPGIERMLGDADQGGEILGGQAAALPAVEDHQSLLGVVRRRFYLFGSSQPASAARAAFSWGQSESSLAEVRDRIETGSRAVEVAGCDPGGFVRAEIAPGKESQGVRGIESGFTPKIGRARRLVCWLDRLDRSRNNGVRIFRFRTGRARKCALVALRFDRVRFRSCPPTILRLRRWRDRFIRRPLAGLASSVPPPAPLVPHLLLASAASPRLGGDADCSGQFSKLRGKHFGWENTFHRQHGDALTMILFRAPEPRQCGIARLDHDGRIVSFTEKPEQPEGDLANAGIYVMDAPAYREIAAMGAFDLSRDVLPHFVGRMRGWVWGGYYLDVGTPEALARAARRNDGHSQAAGVLCDEEGFSGGAKVSLRTGPTRIACALLTCRSAAPRGSSRAATGV